MADALDWRDTNAAVDRLYVESLPQPGHGGVEKPDIWKELSSDVLRRPSSFLMLYFG